MEKAIGNSYGKELVLDLNDCDIKTFTRKSIGVYFDQLCELIDMEAQDRHFWDDEGLPPEECQTNPKTKGVSAVQFILTSTIVIHTLELPKSAYINIFSCKDFDEDKARDFTVKWFGAEMCDDITIIRGVDYAGD